MLFEQNEDNFLRSTQNAKSSDALDQRELQRLMMLHFDNLCLQYNDNSMTSK